MKTLIVSDLHFGSASRADVLRHPQVRQALFDRLADVDRLVLLGDVLELRHGPQREALKAARPFFEQLGAVMAGREILLLAGNHDHALVEGWLQERAEQDDPPPLRLEQRFTPQQASSLAARLAQWAAPARIEVAHPGVWLREDVYATHGHYLDAHITVPTMERLAVGLMGKMLRRPENTLGCVDDYEAVTAPIYAWICAVAAQGATRSALNGSATVRMWRLLHGSSGRGRRGAAAASWAQADSGQTVSTRPDGAQAGNAHADGAQAAPSAGSTQADSVHAGSAQAGSAQPGRDGAAAEMRRGLLSTGLGHGLRAGALRRGFPLAVAALDRAGLGPLKPDISGPELRKACLSAMGEVAARLGLGDTYVVFGHTHRAGPLPGDGQDEWRGRLGARLINTGSWTYNSGFLSPGETENPYWPGSCVLVEDGERGEELSPRVVRLLAHLSHTSLEELFKPVS